MIRIEWIMSYYIPQAAVCQIISCMVVLLIPHQDTAVAALADLCRPSDLNLDE